LAACIFVVFFDRLDRFLIGFLCGFPFVKNTTIVRLGEEQQHEDKVHPSEDGAQDKEPK
jgi:hypothetical protein